jgi:hypothetical protein
MMPLPTFMMRSKWRILKIYKGETKLAFEPCGTSLYWDFIGLCEGCGWPDDDDLSDEYKQ